jgi:hypothetical protein
VDDEVISDEDLSPPEVSGSAAKGAEELMSRMMINRQRHAVRAVEEFK